uniref:Uncharacterized protein n=1 Tax=Triticum urartu TaxID=4572 RepID=A0A8R7QXH0_TRIUA
KSQRIPPFSRTSASAHDPFLFSALLVLLTSLRCSQATSIRIWLLNSAQAAFDLMFLSKR